MNEHPLTYILNQLAAEGAPADLDLRAAVHQRLETSKTHSFKGVLSMKTSFAHPRRLAATIAIVILLLAAAFLLTPQGRAWAQWAAGLIAKPTSTKIDPRHITNIADAEALVGYFINPLDPIPAGYAFEYASVDQATRSVCLRYVYTWNPGPYLLIAQGPANLAPKLVAAPDRFGDATEIEATESYPVYVGGAQEAFFIFGKARSHNWACTSEDTNSSHDKSWLTLTWQFGQRQYDLYAPWPFMSRCDSEDMLNELDLLRVAETLTGVSTHPENEFDPACTQDIATLEKRAGFDVKLPTWLPRGWRFRGASLRASYWNPEVDEVTLYYRLLNKDYSDLSIHQIPVTITANSNLLDLVKAAMSATGYPDFPPQGYELLTLNDVPAVIIDGFWTDFGSGPVWYQIPSSTPTLWWEENGILFSIHGPWNGQIAIAESMK